MEAIKASAAHLFKMTSTLLLCVYPRDMIKVPCACVENRNVLFYSATFEHKTQTTASASDQTERGEAAGAWKRGTKPSLHSEQTQQPVSVALSASVCRSVHPVLTLLAVIS